MSSKFKRKDNIILCRGMEINKLEDSIHRALNYALNRLEEEGFETDIAYSEANKVVFAYANPFISGSTIAQWLASGGDEKRAFEAIKDYISESKKVKKISKEVKTISARIFSSH